MHDYIIAFQTDFMNVKLLGMDEQTDRHTNAQSSVHASEKVKRTPVGLVNFMIRNVRLMSSHQNFTNVHRSNEFIHFRWQKCEINSPIAHADSFHGPLHRG